MLHYQSYECVENYDDRMCISFKYFFYFDTHDEYSKYKSFQQWYIYLRKCEIHPKIGGSNLLSKQFKWQKMEI